MTVIESKCQIYYLHASTFRLNGSHSLCATDCFFCFSEHVWNKTTDNKTCYLIFSVTFDVSDESQERLIILQNYVLVFFPKDRSIVARIARLDLFLAPIRVSSARQTVRLSLFYNRCLIWIWPILANSCYIERIERHNVWKIKKKQDSNNNNIYELYGCINRKKFITEMLLWVETLDYIVRMTIHMCQPVIKSCWIHRRLIGVIRSLEIKREKENKCNDGTSCCAQALLTYIV